MIKKLFNAFNKVLETIAVKLSKVLKPFVEKLSNMEPGVLKKWLTRFLLVEIVFFIVVAICRRSISSIFSDAFNATTVGGLYSFVLPFFENLDNPLAGLEEADLSGKAFLMWTISGFGYMVLSRYNKLVDRADYGQAMQIIHSILFTMFIGIVGSPVALLLLGVFFLPLQPLWATGFLVLRLLAVVLGFVGMGLLVVMLGFALKSLVSTLIDFAKFYVFALILLVALAVFFVLLSKLVGLMYDSALLSPIMSFIDSLLISAGVTEDSGANLITSATFVKVALGVGIFLMYNISAVFHDEGLVI